MRLNKYSFFYWLVAMMILTISSCTTIPKENTLFVNLPAASTGIQFTNTLEKRPLFNILYYLYYYNGGGVATGDINNDGLPDIYFTANHPSGNRLYLNKGNFKFEDITQSAGVAGTADWCTGVTMMDINGDGKLDIYTSAIGGRYNLKGHNQLFVNLGNNRFADSAAAYGLDYTGPTTQAAFFDYDHDGDLDCYLLNQSHHPHANIVDTMNRRIADTVNGDRLYRNDLTTNRRFTNVSAKAGIYQSSLGYGLGIAVADMNQDGWEDIYIGNDFHENDYYYLNNGNGTFTESSAKHFRHYSRFSMGNDVADYNNDGQPDVVTVDMLPPDEKILKTYGSDENADIYKVKLELHGYQHQYSKNCLQRNNGRGSSFSETALQSGMAATDWSWAPLFADFDNDGNKDLFITSGIVKRPVDLDYIRFVTDLDMRKGRQQTDKYDEEAIAKMPDGQSHPFVFKGDGAGQFTDNSKAWGTAGLKGYFNGASYADLDNDGNVDVVINCINAPAVILQNQAPARQMVNLSLKGLGYNRLGIGAKCWLFVGGKMQYQQLMPTRGFQSSVEPRLHFGIDTLKYIDSLLVVWPSQRYQWLKNIPARGNMELQEVEAGGQFTYDTYFPTPTPALTNITVQVGINWRHSENDYLDYNNQYLIPHLLSTRGPKLAVADVNGDGLDDFYACGAAGQSGRLFTQSITGTFIAADTTAFAAARQSEEVDALFFDADNDGDADLYVVSGGNQYNNNDSLLADHLYLNNGAGRFTAATLPALLYNKACVAAADVDKNGTTDLFVGGLSNIRQYGQPQNSYLLLNDGKANFTITTKEMDSIGMVTSAAFSDFNHDGWPDLVVAGEWMPVKVFINQKGTLQPATLPASTGLWQSLCVTDVNNDGNDDILAGNWGHNSKLRAGKNAPLKLYCKDFDKNGTVEQILCYTIEGKEYTFLAKDELERALPVLRKAYLTYSEVAGQTVQYMFYDLFKDYMTLQAETTGSTCFLGNGKGDFIQQELPVFLQTAPIMCFAPEPGSNHIWAAGNFYGVIPYEGRYDALLPTLFKWNNKNFTPNYTLPALPGDQRDAKWLKAAGNKHILVVASNNQPLAFFKKNEK